MKKINQVMINNGCYNLHDFVRNICIYNNMINTQIPPQLTYNKIYPKGFYSTFKEWQVEPLNGGNTYWPGQIVKIPFLGMAPSGVFDPYKSHVLITVTSSISTLPVGQLRVDNSAQSFIQQLVINSGTRQIQRIPQYGILAAWLNDLGLSDVFAQGKQVQGLGYSNLQSIQGISWKPSHRAAQVTTYMPSQQSPIVSQLQCQYGFPGIFPTQSSNWFLGLSWGTGIATNAGIGQFQDSQKLVPGHITPINCGWVNLPMSPASSTDYSTTTSISQYGFAKNLRAEYINAVQSAKYPQTTSTQAPLNIGLNPSVFNSVWPAYFAQGTSYQLNMNQTQFPYYRQYVNSTGTTTAINQNLPNLASIVGFTNLCSPAFMKGTCQPFISPTVPQLQMQYGNILPYKIPVATRVFSIPLISSIMGILIPQSQFSLLPVTSLSNLQLQLTLDPFAMFTSGYCDISQYDTAGMNVQQPRAFQIQNILYNLHLYQFGPSIDQYVKASLNKQILFNSHAWTLSNQYQIATGQQVTNAWQVACQSQSLSEVLTLFVPSDYLHYTYCRKHFRISNNLLKLQYRINMDYFPPQPIYGCAGNPVAIDSFGDNSPFLDLLYWSQNYHFQPGIPMPRINAYNFAINQRCYNVQNTQPLYQVGMLNNLSYSIGPTTINADTAMGMPDVHQNRYVGKAGYPFSFQPYAHSADFMIGLDCRDLKQFDIILSADSNQYFPRQQVMYIYIKSNIIVSYTPQGIFITGK